MTSHLARSELSVPGSSRRMIEKAVTLPADTVIIDLEDSVTPDMKAAARKNVIRAVHELDWGEKGRAYRINPVGTPHFYRDLVEVVPAASGSIDKVVVPKLNRAEDLVAVDILLSSIELDLGLAAGSITIEAQIETAEGLVNVEKIAASAARLDSLNFGPGDFAAGAHIPAESIGTLGTWDELYPGHRFHYPMSRVVVAARSAGLQAIDGPVANFRDLDAFRRSCVIARSLGYDGKWCIHPSQIPIANEVFSPTAAEVDWARRVVTAYGEETAAGRGAISIDGTMVDVASVRLAERTLELSKRVGML